MVQIVSFSQSPNWSAPWQFHPVNRGSGTGFVIEGNRIMTNAHVVGWARQILVLKYQDPRPYAAKVQFVGHDCDLAILEIADPGFFDGLEPLYFGSLPEVRSTVVTYGYPAGGEQISYTRGVVSRIEVQNYSHIGNRAFLTVQTDAAINPGNSGGPVIQGDKVVGVAFQGISGLENTGFFIPPSVIQHFLKDTLDGVYHGFPQAGVRLAPLQNFAFRAYLKLQDNAFGARIDHIVEIPTTLEKLRVNDVLLQVGDYPVASDATILYEGNRVSASAAFHEAQHGDSIGIKILREGKPIEIELPIYFNETDHLTANQYDVPPRYYIHAGLVFTPLSLDYMRTFGNDWADAASADILYELYYRHQEKPETVRPEPVVLATTLAHPVNANLSVKARVMVDSVNGKKINRLEDLISAIESNEDDFHVIQFVAQKTIECVDRIKSETAQNEILATYGIASDRRL